MLLEGLESMRDGRVETEGGGARRLQGSKLLGLALLLPVAVAIVAFSAGAVRSLLKPAAPALGALAPELHLQTLSGEPLAPEALRGRVVLFELWATWCSGCQAFAPVMRRLDRDYADRGLTVVGVNLGEDPEHVKRYVEEKELHYPQVIDRGPFVETYRLAGTPAYVLLDRQGRVSAIGRRMDAEVVLRGKIEPLLR